MGVKIKLTTAILQYKNTKKLNIATHLFARLATSFKTIIFSGTNTLFPPILDASALHVYFTHIAVARALMGGGGGGVKST